MKILNLLKRRWIGAAVLAALMIAPVFALAPSAEARPPRHVSAYGYRRNRVVVERYTPRYNTYRRTYTRRAYVAPIYKRGRYTTHYRNGRPYRVYIR